MSSAIITGTGFEGRASVIRKHCKNNATVIFIRERNNKYDNNAIAAYLIKPILFGLLGTIKYQIGYLKKPLAKRLALKMEGGSLYKAHINSFYCPPHIEHPRVSIVYKEIKN